MALKFVSESGEIMTNNAAVSHPLNTYRRSKIEGFDILEELALNLRWSWNHRTDKIWQKLDPELWDLTHNPWIVLQTVSRNKLEDMLADPEFRDLINDQVKTNRIEAKSPGWFQKTHPQSPLTCAAYFSMEFMLTEAIPIYSGGLGNVAGDQLKAASDLGIPVVAIGLLYQEGYFRQMIDKEGAQQALYPYNDPGQLPITPLRKQDGEWLRIEIAFPGYSLWFRAWQVQAGRVKLYLLDSNDAANLPAYRAITSQLYGGGSDLRLKQEILLGIGGWRLLEALGIKPEVCHLNEGHAAFAVLERALSFMRETKQSFEVSLACTRAGNIFTTHTAVPAGFDRFSPKLIEQYLTNYAKNKLGISVHDLLALGRLNPNDDTEDFNMAYLAVRGSGAINGVSRLHAKVSREIFSPLFPRWPQNEVPIGYVTNGVHMPSWDSKVADDLWTESCGKNRWLDSTENLEKKIRSLPDDKIWQMRNSARKTLCEYVRKRLAMQWGFGGASTQETELAKKMFDPNILTLGFARRFATYKRPNMLLQDPERLVRILTNSQRPVQLIIAGKAHPADKQGQAMIQEWMLFLNRPEVRPHVIFLSDYDMLLTEQLVQGVDVWLNTPRRPWEACGTSGMKVLVNGGLNLSELDGWWAEAYSKYVGWALGDGQEHSDVNAWDNVEANQLYDLLEHEVIPEFYNRNAAGMPTTWIARIRESMARLTPQYSANRAVREYAEHYYLPAATEYRKRADRNAAQGCQLVNWHNTLEKNWQNIGFGEVKITTTENEHKFEVSVYLNDLNPKAVKVELYSDGFNDTKPVRCEMTLMSEKSNESKSYVYRGSVPSTRPAWSYTPRIIPKFEDAAVPLEDARILWQK